MSTMRRTFFVRCASFVFATAFALSSAFAQSTSESASAPAFSPATESSSSLLADLSYPDGMGTSGPSQSPAYTNRYADNHGLGHKLARHYALEFGGGFNAPTSDSTPYVTWGGNFTVGAGYNFSPHFALLAEYQFIDAKLPANMISQAYTDGGNTHIWSFGLEPVVSLFPKAHHDVYITGGGGFYRKMTNFTDPTLAMYCDYYDCGYGTATAVVGHYSSNQGGVNIGAGYQYRLGGPCSNSRMKLFAEARYLHIFSPAGTYYPTYTDAPVTVGEGTTIIPVTFGVRW